MASGFYVWLQMFDAALMLLGLALNVSNKRMLILTATVGAGVLLPVMPTQSPELFYIQCLLMDTFVMIMAYLIRAKTASSIVVFLSSLLCGLHISGLILGPSDGVGVYRISIPLFEISQLLTCILASGAFIQSIRIVKYSGTQKNG